MKKCSRILAYATIGAVAAAAPITFAACTSMGGAPTTVTAINALGIAKTGASLSQTEVAAGLKEALNIGIKTGIGYLAAKNGYYNDMAVKIGLPPEAGVIVQNISKIPQGNTLVENVVKSINTAASDAVGQTVPIFADALTSMSINDAMKILKGNNTAATSYFKTKTKTGLKGVFGGYIDKSIEKKLIGDISAKSSWNTLTGKWNTVANTVVGKAANLKPVNTDLNDFLTDKAVDGVYVKVGEQETKIRTKASERTTDLLRKVFGH